MVTETIRARFDTLFLRGLDADRVVVEKSPMNAMRLGLLDALTNEPRFVHIVRDGAEVARSISDLATANRYRIAGRPRFNTWWGTEDAKWRFLARDGADAGYFPDEVGLLRTHEQRGAYEWLVSLLEVDARREALGSRLFELTYHELISDPGAALQRIGAFLGLSPDEPWIRSARMMVRPNHRLQVASLALPPKMSDAFNRYASRYGFQGRSTATEVDDLT